MKGYSQLILLIVLLLLSSCGNDSFSTSMPRLEYGNSSTENVSVALIFYPTKTGDTEYAIYIDSDSIFAFRYVNFYDGKSLSTHKIAAERIGRKMSKEENDSIAALVKSIDTELPTITTLCISDTWDCEMYINGRLALWLSPITFEKRFFSHTVPIDAIIAKERLYEFLWHNSPLEIDLYGFA